MWCCLFLFTAKIKKKKQFNVVSSVAEEMCCTSSLPTTLLVTYFKRVAHARNVVRKLPYDYVKRPARGREGIPVQVLIITGQVDEGGSLVVIPLAERGRVNGDSGQLLPTWEYPQCFVIYLYQNVVAVLLYETRIYVQ